MKKHLSLLSVLFIMSVSCQTELIDIPDIDELSSLTKFFTIESIDADTPIVFLPEKDKDIWTRIETLEDRFAACSVSQERLDSMTTEALGKSILNYPLNYLVFVFTKEEYPFYKVPVKDGLQGTFRQGHFHKKYHQYKFFHLKMYPLQELLLLQCIFLFLFLLYYSLFLAHLFEIGRNVVMTDSINSVAYH